MKSSIGLQVVLVLLGMMLLTLSISYLSANAVLGWLGAVGGAVVLVGGVLGIIRQVRTKRSRS